MIRPASNFLFCFGLETGVKAVAWLHLVECAFTCVCAIGNVVLQVPTFGYTTSGTSQIYAAAWSLVGIPVILVGLWGIYQRMEAHVRLYSYYLGASVAMDGLYFANLLLFTDACVHVKLVAYVGGGQAFSCGVARSISIAVFAFLSLVAVYLLYIVWSYCEDLASGGTASIIFDLLRSVDKEGVYGSSKPGMTSFYDTEYDNVRPSTGKGGRIEYAAMA